MSSEFRWRRKDCNDVMETRLSGSAFQILAAATGNARLPTVERWRQFRQTSRAVPRRSASWCQ